MSRAKMKCATLFAACPDAVERTQEIADRCNVEFEFGVTRLPHYPVPRGRNRAVDAHAA